MNIRDIARLANVTPGTVSKVLNHYPDISEHTRQHVMKIIQENQYTPSNNARSLKLSSKIPQICIGMESVYNWVYQNMAERLSIRLHNADHTILFFNDNYYAQSKTEKFQELLVYIDKHNITGMVYFGCNFSEIPAQYFQSLPCPVIFVNTVLPNCLDTGTYSSVQVNHYETAWKQMEYLIEKGHKDICMLISSRIDTSIYQVRWQAYEDVLKKHSLEHCLSHVVESDYRCHRAHRNLTGYLTDHPEITAICSSADIMAPGALRAIHDIGKAPGRDIALISFDGIESMSYCVPSIATFEQPQPEMVNYIYDLLLGLMENKRQHQHITFHARFMENESCTGTAGQA